MSIPRPTGGYVEQMLDPGGWPEVDEAILYDRARLFTRTLHQHTELLESWQKQQAQVFEGGIWSGGAADAANSELGTNIDALTMLQNGIATVITWHNHTAGTIERTKSTIIDNLEFAHQRITALHNDPSLDAPEREAAINSVVAATHGANVNIVAATAEQILATKSWKPPGNALQDLLDRTTPSYPPVDDPALPGAPSPGEPSPGEPSGEQPPSPTPTPTPTPTPAPAPTPTPTPAPAPAPAPDGESPQTPPGVVVPPAPGIPPAVARPPGSSAPSPGSPVAPGTVDPSSPAPDVGPAAPLSPAASTPPPSGDGAGRAKGVAPASVTSPTVGPPPREDGAAVAPASATGPPPTSMSPAMPGGAAGAASGAGAGSGAPVRPKPLGTPPTPKPAASSGRPSTRTGRAPSPDPPDRVQPPDVAAMAAVPVSAARAARDAVAASTADAARRRDPLQLARRIAAALNAPGSNGDGDMGFFWITAVTRDGEIVVANSYGLAYLPEEVQLPERVHMASADETIPATERARWATYPAMAVQGWATHHDTRLRAVIGTEQQLANSDPGAAKVVLQPDDVPDSGDMAGRSRLEVVNPEAAEQLSETSDLHLTGLLPPPPASIGPPAGQPQTPDAKDPAMAAQLKKLLSGELDPSRLMDLLPPIPVDATPPSADRRAALWFEVIKPMATQAAGREGAHLRAFHTYAAHAQEVAAAEAHDAVEPTVQRAAVADWLYWKHLTGLLDQALADIP